MRKKIVAFLHHYRRERSGILLLLTLSLIGWSWPEWYATIRPVPTADLQEFEATLIRLDSAAAQNRDEPAAAFYFDPNTISREELIALGVRPATASTLLRYRDKGGRFNKAADLQKIYGLKSNTYERLAPFVRIRTKKGKSKKKAPQKQPELFQFDPNTVGFADLIALGLPEKTARTLINYREKGGRFSTPEDLGRIYGLSNKVMDRLSPYVLIPATTSLQTDNADTSNNSGSRQELDHFKTAPNRVDINKATKEEWQALYGIGPVLSERIIRFRDKLGGFVAIGQVAETYGLPDSTFLTIRPYLIESPVHTKLAINHLDWQAIAAHPYLNTRQAKGVVAYRQHHGPFKSGEDLKRVRALPLEVIEKIMPYLQFN